MALKVLTDCYLNLSAEVLKGRNYSFLDKTEKGNYGGSVSVTKDKEVFHSSNPVAEMVKSNHPVGAKTQLTHWCNEIPGGRRIEE